MTVLPSVLVTGILAGAVGKSATMWAAFFVRPKRRGLMLMLLSIVPRLNGSGAMPVANGVVIGVIGTRIDATPAVRRPPSPALGEAMFLVSRRLLRAAV